MILTLDGRIRFSTREHGEPFNGLCRIRIYEHRDFTNFTAILTQLPYEESVVSITNAIETIAREVLAIQNGRISRFSNDKNYIEIRWIAHYPPTVSTSGENYFQQIFLERYDNGQRFRNPLWGTCMTRSQVESIIGCPFEV